MKVSSISTANNKPSANFKGHWETRTAVLWTIPDHRREIKDYIPDENESLRESVYAWAAETGKKPFQWVQENNIYAPKENEVQYRFNGTPYLPVKLIKASVEEDLNNQKRHWSGFPDKTRLLELHAKLAYLDAQVDNREGVKGNEAEMKSIYFNKKYSSRWDDYDAFTLDTYKNNYSTILVEQRDREDAEKHRKGLNVEG